ncbi:RDD domain containing protein [Halodesulfurarchaeum formicicum]|uniref:RDD domain containing protein n=1 Tax=Halodesulfurarchaeum formicicum TaxID=1873524 RepID=A0A1D8S2W8_9EURY|nr:RDD family protein [Halodesulfurarchaeum formicicum]AOW79683.1 RDD domain containing protein [Halodesulfurarchaeum formicicum]APE94933.1 RDD domain containing protein [Halodesulfurarchaeum formicicum]
MVRSNPRLETRNDTLIARLLAFAVDAVLLTVGLAVLGGVTATVAPRLVGVVGLLIWPLALGYFVVFEWTSGQTPGKRLFGITVVQADGRPASLLAAILRNVLRIVDALPTAYLLGGVLIYRSDDGQRLGDVIGNTVVVKTGS